MDAPPGARAGRSSPLPSSATLQWAARLGLLGAAFLLCSLLASLGPPTTTITQPAAAPMAGGRLLNRSPPQYAALADGSTKGKGSKADVPPSPIEQWTRVTRGR